MLKTQAHTRTHTRIWYIHPQGVHVRRAEEASRCNYHLEVWVRLRVRVRLTCRVREALRGDREEGLGKEKG